MHKFKPSLTARLRTLVLLMLGIWLVLAPSQTLPSAAAPLAAPPEPSVYIPIATRNSPWHSPFGVQVEVPLLKGSAILNRAVELGTGWARMGPISWRRMQPTEGGAIDWSVLARLEQELRAVKEQGITPEIVVFDSPSWATINKPYVTSCGAIRADKFSAFASFMRELILRYSTPEFNVHHWELGNEIDVDPRLVAPNNGFGCWGNINDPNYGGAQYGEMLKAVAPVIRATDPNAQIWIGGLLLDVPNTTEPGKGKPELFLQGILSAGAAPYFDMIPFHAYTPYLNTRVDPNNPPGSPWYNLGGSVLGKAKFLRQIMAKYGVNKPLFLNETALMCPGEYWPYSKWCNPPQASFFDMQAVYGVRSFTRALAADIKGALWYTLNGPSWRYVGLLDAQNQPRPAFTALKVLGQQLETAEYIGPVNYGNGVEAYAFGRYDRRVHVVWAIEDYKLAISVPQAKFISAVDRNGKAVTPSASGTNYLFIAAFDPLYISLKP